MEQYLTTPGQSRLMDRWAEGILSTLIEIAPRIRENQHNYDLMADFMLSATMGLNGFIAMGVTQDWATHMIGHELTALHGLTHGATLAIVFNGTLRTLRKQNTVKSSNTENVYGASPRVRMINVSISPSKKQKNFSAAWDFRHTSVKKISEKKRSRK